MIITCTPLRISFAGGGTDLHDFYGIHDGAVLSTTINKYLYVTVKRHGRLFNENFRLNYSETEHVANLEDVKNDIARECLRLVPVEPPVYVSTVADLPASSGLGSSSSFAVGLLNALHALRGERTSAGQLAEEAAYVEIEVLKRPIGKQDQYAAAFGGLNYIRFLSDGGVTLEPQSLSPEKLIELFKHILMFWTGIARDSSSVLTEQKLNMPNKLDHLLAMRDQAQQLRSLIRNGLDFKAFGMILDSGWKMKRQLASSITNTQIDSCYQSAIEAGSMGGKLCGAGGGGFLLFLASPEHHPEVRRMLNALHEISINYEPQGSRILMSQME